MSEDIPPEIEEQLPVSKEDIVLKRLYIVPLVKAWAAPRKKRVPRAVRLLKEFAKRHMKAEEVWISNAVNEILWRRGIEKPPRKIRVRAVRDREGTVTVYLAEGD